MKSEVVGNNALYLKSLAACLHKITVDGYTDSFIPTQNGFQSYKTNKTYLPEEIQVINSYWFESSVENNRNRNIAALHVIETRDGNKGTLVDAGNAPTGLMDKIKK
ncbi:MAG: hypothetical protein QM731_15895 [Chitinophagaceae bacterium]